MDQLAVLSFSPFGIDLANEQLWREGRLVHLRSKTFAILRYLAEHPGRLVTKDELLHAVWGNTQVSEEGLRDYLREIRQALGDEAATPRFVETVRGRGYRFLPAVTVRQVPSPRFQVPNSRPKHSGLITQHSALVGRDADLTQLCQRLEKAMSGERQLVFVTGEPGIGKTALVDAFRQRLGTRDWRQVSTPQASSLKPLTSGRWLGWGQCIEQHGVGEAFLPILDALERLCRESEGEHLVEVLRHHAPMWLVQLPAFVETEELEALQRKVQGASRERMLREMTEALEVLTVECPVILILEDLHWSDVSTLDLLAFIARRKEPARLMVIGTYRPAEMLSEEHPLKDVTQELYAHGLAAELMLGALSKAAIAQYLDWRLSVPSPLRGEGQGEGDTGACFQHLVHVFHYRTGGNPLFLVAMVDDLVNRGVLAQTDEGWILQDNEKMIEIPDTIRQLVARQRERLRPEDQCLLEAASVAGMEFSAAAAAAALSIDTTTVERRCEHLAQRQQFLKRLDVEAWPDGVRAARYGFLHALDQQLWREQVTPTQLQHYHLQIGERKEQAYGERVPEIAAELAVHFEQGRNYRKAVQYLEHVGRNATQRSANQEAVSLLTKGLELLKTLPETPERDQQELTLQITLGNPLIAIKGYAAPEVENAYTRARELCRRVSETPQLISALRELQIFYSTRGELPTAHELAEQALRLAQKVQDPFFLMWGHSALGETLFWLGKLTAAQEQNERAIALDDRRPRSSWEWIDPKSFLPYTALALWMLGYPDQALSRSQEVLTLAQEIAHPFSLAWALHFATWLHQCRREVHATQERAEALIALCIEQGFPFWLAPGMRFRGWALTEQGQEEEGLAHLRQGRATEQDASVKRVGRSHFFALIAAAYKNAGRPEEGLNVLVEALAAVDKTGERYYEAELYRLYGELSLRIGEAETGRTGDQKFLADSPFPRFSVSSPEECFLKAIDIARRQQAKMLELRATVSLARLWQRQGKKNEAQQMLAEIYNWFTEGFDTVDLKEAKALLDELSL